MTLCLGLAIAVWTKRSFGPGAALLALTFYAFDPTVVAQGRYVKNDVPLALFAFLACIAWESYLNRPSRRRLILSGIAAGCAFGTKYSAIFLLPVLVILCAIRSWQRKTEAPPGALPSLGGVGLSAALVVLLVYAPAAAALVSVSRRLGLQAHPLLEGMVRLLNKNYGVNNNYLLGNFSSLGWWYYFPAHLQSKRLPPRLRLSCLQ